MDREKNYRDTIKEAKDLDDAHIAGKKRREAEIAYESLAAASSMGLFGSEQEVVELIELELARQLQYHLAPDGPHVDAERND